MECFIYLTIFAKSETFSFLIPPSKKNLFRSYPLWLCICPVDRFFPLQPQSYHPLPKPSRICFWLLWNPSLSFLFFFSHSSLQKEPFSFLPSLALYLPRGRVFSSPTIIPTIPYLNPLGFVSGYSGTHPYPSPSSFPPFLFPIPFLSFPSPLHRYPSFYTSTNGCIQSPHITCTFFVARMDIPQLRQIYFLVLLFPFCAFSVFTRLYNRLVPSPCSFSNARKLSVALVTEYPIWGAYSTESPLFSASVWNRRLWYLPRLLVSRIPFTRQYKCTISCNNVAHTSSYSRDKYSADRLIS